MVKEIIYVILGLSYIIAGAVILSKAGVKTNFKYSELYLEQKQLTAYIYNLNTILK